MLILSNNLRKYIKIPSKAIIRINLAWYATEYEVLKNIKECKKYKVLLDFPKNRKKPPVTNYSLKSLLLFAKERNVEYFSVSNVESKEDITKYNRLNLKIIPKIETLAGIKNIQDILSVLIEPKVIMLDHEDLYNDLLRNNIDTSLLYDKYVKILECYNIKILKTAGIVFSD